MENKTTPGPWHAGLAEMVKYEDAPTPLALAVFARPECKQDGADGNAACVAIISQAHLVTKEDVDNARLIAAAPALLEVCRNTITLTCKHASEEHSKLWAEAAAAYRCALGDSDGKAED